MYVKKLTSAPKELKEHDMKNVHAFAIGNGQWQVVLYDHRGFETRLVVEASSKDDAIATFFVILADLVG